MGAATLLTWHNKACQKRGKGLVQGDRRSADLKTSIASNTCIEWHKSTNPQENTPEYQSKSTNAWSVHTVQIHHACWGLEHIRVYVYIYIMLYIYIYIYIFIYIHIKRARERERESERESDETADERFQMLKAIAILSDVSGSLSDLSPYVFHQVCGHLSWF